MMIFYNFSFLDFERYTRTNYKFNFIKIGKKSLIKINYSTDDKELYVELFWITIYRRFWNLWGCTNMSDRAPLIIEWFGREVKK